MPDTDGDTVRHVMVDTPNWDTKVRCLCGADFTSRCEFYKHGYEALLALLEESHEPDNERGVWCCQEHREAYYAGTLNDGVGP